MTNEKLSPLEALRRIRVCHNLECGEDKTMNELLNIIETALKDYLRHKKIIDCFNKEPKLLHNIQNVVKALEIIKRDYYLVAECLDKYENFEEIQKYMGVYSPIKNQEEFDLLKEELL